MAAHTDAPLRRRLTALDSSFLYTETANSPLHIGAFTCYEGHIPFEKVFEFVAKLIDVVPRYRQRLAEVPLYLGHSTLADDPDFKLENHVIRKPLPEGLSEAE